VQRGAADDLPYLFQILGKRHVAPFGGLDARIAAENLQCRPDAGEDEIGAAHPFLLQPRHPFANAIGQFAQHIGPVADPVLDAGPADEMHTPH
jgi:hypothetical protein